MSVRVTSWVWEHSHASGWARLVMLAVADEANDRGYLSGKEYGSVERLADKAKVNRKTVMRYVEELEQLEELLVYRPASRGHGRHNEYVVLMGRDISDVCRERGWTPTPPSDGSLPGTGSVAASSGGAPSPDLVEQDPDPVPDAVSVHRGAQAAPPAGPDDLSTEAVDTVSARPADESLTGTVSPRKGPGPVQDRSLQHGHSPCTPVPTTLTTTGCSETEPGWTAGVAVDNPRGEPLTRVQAALAPLAPAVDWSGLTSRDMLELSVHMAAWPTVDDAVEDFIDAGQRQLDLYGAPRSARAWRTTWLELTPPAVTAGEPLCTQHAPVGYDVAVRTCPQCRQNAVTPQRTAVSR